jgi:hypothetical protein
MTESPATPAASGYRVPLARPKTARRTVATTDPTSSIWQILGIVLVVGALILYALGQWVLNHPTGMGLIVAPILTIVSMALLARPIKAERSFDLRGLLLTSIGLRLLFAYPRFSGAADARVYNTEGARLAQSFRGLDFVHVDVGAGAPVPGTGSLRYITGLVHLLTDSNFFGSTIVFTFVAFWASWFFYRAFVIAVPSGNRLRYGRFVMLWPSIAYWPSSIGKDSWMFITIALAALGAAKMLTRGRGAYLLIALGLTGASLVRPHVALLMFAAILVAFLVGRRDHRAMPGTISLGGITKAFGIVILLVGGSLLAPATARFLNINDLSTTGVTTALSDTQAQTSEGNSAFKPVNPNSPIGYPEAVFTVLFRPLPGELTNASGLAASLESAALLLLALVGWRRILGAMHRLRSEAYLTLALAYVAMFGYAFSAIANFGILTRERVQVLPFLFVPLSLPKWHREPAEHRAGGRRDRVRTRPPAPSLRPSLRRT